MTFTISGRLFCTQATNRLTLTFSSIALFLFVFIQVPPAQAGETPKNVSYADVIAQTASMVSNSNAASIANKHGLSILNVTWEDTGRYKGSSVGPNISDMTIQIQHKDPVSETYSLTCMPVIRFPNFDDKSCDISPDSFYLLVGNEKGKRLKRITLTEYLKNIRSYMSKPYSWKGDRKSLFAKRDTHVLVSAQACFLPVPKKGIAEFNPVLFNYQSYQKDPAVLAVLATREGTSATIIDNTRDRFDAGQTWGQRLFFNHKGSRTSLTGKRLSEFISETKKKNGSNSTEVSSAAGNAGLNMVMLIQIPLKQKRPMRHEVMFESKMDESSAKSAQAPSAKKSDVENAVIGHGKVEGPFTEMDDIDIERDENYPIRVTVQFYKATSNGEVSENDVKEIRAQIDRVYKSSSYAGSLVTEGNTRRPTEYIGPKFQPPGWWESFWKRYHSNTGLTPDKTIRIMRREYGKKWKPADENSFRKDITRIEKTREKKN